VMKGHPPRRKWSSSQTGDTPSPSSLACCGHSVSTIEIELLCLACSSDFFDETQASSNCRRDRVASQLHKAEEEAERLVNHLDPKPKSESAYERQLTAANDQVAQFKKAAQSHDHSRKQLEKTALRHDLKLTRAEQRLRQKTDENEGITKAEAKARRQRDAAYEELAVARLDLATSIERETRS